MAENSKIEWTPTDFNHDLVFDKGESGAAQYSYYGLMTDCQSPADILIRVNRRGDYVWEKAEELAKEVVKRWNCYSELALALDGSDRLIQAAQNIIAEWILPDSPTTDAQAMEKLLGLFDGPFQRRVQGDTKAVLTKTKGVA